MGFFYWGEANNPRKNDEPRGQWRDVDPGKVRWHHNDVNEEAVEFYMRNPRGRFDGRSGDPYIEVDGSGRMRGYNGRHRGEAARRQGRKLRARVVDERG